MLDPLIQIVINHKSQAISKEAYQAWKDSPVTRQLLFDIASDVLDSLVDELPNVPIAEIGSIAVAREQAAATAINVIDWSPTEVEKEDDQ